MENRLNPKNSRRLSAILRHARKGDRPGLTDARLERSSQTTCDWDTPFESERAKVHPVTVQSHALGQTWAFWYMETPMGDAILPALCHYHKGDSVIAIDQLQGRPRIHGDHLQELLRSCPAFLAALCEIHDISTPRTEQRFPLAAMLSK